MARRQSSRRKHRRDPLFRPFALIQPRLYRRGQLAAYLNISAAQLDLLRLAPDFPRPISMPSTRNPSGRVRVPLWDRLRIDKWVEEQQQKVDDEQQQKVDTDAA